MMYRKTRGMPDLPAGPDSDNTATPRWVKLLGIAAVVFLLLFAIVHLVGGGFHHHAPAGYPPPHHRPEQP
jgi:hypothetical protein